MFVDGSNVATLQPGRSFGELALFNCPRNASIIAKTECFLWQIDRERFKALVAEPFKTVLQLSKLSNLSVSCSDGAPYSL